MTNDTKNSILASAIIFFLGLFAIMTIWGLFALGSVYSVWSQAKAGEAALKEAEWTRQITVTEAQAKLDSASLLAKSEVERAKGVAEANKIIGDSLKGNESYLRYLWIDSLQHTQDKVIYVPTEAGLPLLEAGKR
jgi:regulator of protease activity HflC (stomatin/prohibitin superfamily)